MSFTIAFYVHHHGSGHFIRAMQVARVLTRHKVILLGSKLPKLHLEKTPNVEFVHLPEDTDDMQKNEHTASRFPDTFHYAPLGIKGIRDRVAILTELFRSVYPLLLVVDVSVEITLLARLCAVPTIVIRQHGLRNDLPHLMAYQSAEILLAPFAEEIYNGEKDWVYNKTIFTGGFSRFSAISGEIEENAKHVAILIGSGGTSIHTNLIQKIAKQCPRYTFHVLGLNIGKKSFPNLFWHGQIKNPHAILKSCECIMGNTGHNTLMEVASLNKRFIGIPEERPFDEQIQKAKSVQDRKGVKIIAVNDLTTQNWANVLAELSKEQADWKGIINEDALPRMAKAIIDTGNQLFKD